MMKLMRPIFQKKNIKVSFLLLCFIILFLSLSFGQNKIGLVDIRLDTTIMQDNRPSLGIAVEISELPGQRFVVEIPEVITWRLSEDKADEDRFIVNRHEEWSFTPDAASASFITANYEYHLRFEKYRDDCSFGLNWYITFVNLSDKSLYDLASFNCWSMNDAPLFKDTLMERTIVSNTRNGNLRLKSVNKTQGKERRTMQFYPVANGIDLSKSPWINAWDVIAPDTLSGNTVSVYSHDGQWLFENIVNSDVAYFFNNWEGDHGCVHVAPLIARILKPGESNSAKGVFKFSRLKYDTENKMKK